MLDSYGIYFKRAIFFLNRVMQGSGVLIFEPGSAGELWEEERCFGLWAKSEG
jgi:hypothetical protein